MNETELDRLLKGKGKQKKRDVEDSDVDSDSEQGPPSKKKILSTVKEVQKDIANLSKAMKVHVPPALYSQVSETFKCQICHSSPLKPPVAFTQCCKNILGCKACSDRWYHGEDGRQKTCPLCRSERAATQVTRLNGLDGFLNTVKSMLCGEGETEAAPGPSRPTSLLSVHVPPAPTFDSEDDLM